MDRTVLKAAVAAVAVMGAVFAEAKTALYTEYLTVGGGLENAVYVGETGRGQSKGITYTKSGDLYGSNWYLDFTHDFGQGERTYRRWAFDRLVESASLPGAYTRFANGNGRRYFYSNQNLRNTTIDPSRYGSYNVTTSAGLEQAALGLKLDNSSQYETAMAMWQECQVDYEYIVTFHDAAHSGAEDYRQTLTNSAFLVANSYSCEGCEFAGWGTSKSGGGVVYEDGEFVEPDNDLNLYARWEPHTYKIQFNGGEGSSGSQDSISAKYHEDITIPGCNFSKTGYRFVGWAKTYGADKADYFENDHVKNLTTADKATVTLYAVWTSGAYTVFFDGNGGTPAVDFKPVCHNEPYGELPTATHPEEPSGGYTISYSLVGWYTERTAGSLRTADSIFTAGRDETLFAHWQAHQTANQYTVTFEAMGGVTPVASKTVTFGENYGELPVPTRTGYDFAGWYTGSEAGSKVVMSDKVTTAADHTLFAHWNPRTFTVVLNRDGGEGGEDSVTATFDAKLPDLGPQGVPTKNGYVFGGYYEGLNGEGVGYYDASGLALAKWEVAASATIYARWLDDPRFKLTLDANGGCFDGDPEKTTLVVDCEEGRLYPAFPVPVAGGGKVFAGWWTEVDFTHGVQKTAADVATKAVSRLYARWKALPAKKTVTVTFNGNGGKVTEPVRTLALGDALGELPGVTYAEGGRRLFGWFDSADGGSRYDADSIITADLTLYAVHTETALNAAIGCDAVALQSAGDYPWGAETDPAYCYGEKPTLRSSDRQPDGEGTDSALVAILPGKGDLGFRYRTELQYDDWRSYSDEFSYPGFSTRESCLDWASQQERLLGVSGKVEWNFHRGMLEDKTAMRRAWLSDFTWQAAAQDQPIAEWDVAVRTPELVFETGGHENWHVTDVLGEFAEGYNGVAATNRLNDGAFTWVRTAVIGPGEIRFRWKTSCEAGYVGTDGKYVDCDRLEFMVDGERLAALDGVRSGFVEYVSELKGSGAHQLVWRYVKDADGKAGADTAYLDGVVWTSTAAPEPTPADAPTLSAVTLADGKLAIEFAADTRFEYVLERTLSLRPPAWSDQVTNTLSTGGTLRFAPVVEPGVPRSFYRVRVQAKSVP